MLFFVVVVVVVLVVAAAVVAEVVVVVVAVAVVVFEWEAPRWLMCELAGPIVQVLRSATQPGHRRSLARAISCFYRA